MFMRHPSPDWYDLFGWLEDYMPEAMEAMRYWQMGPAYNVALQIWWMAGQPDIRGYEIQEAA
jgi:hypothetical protein